jgi:hypothetical protein
LNGAFTIHIDVVEAYTREPFTCDGSMEPYDDLYNIEAVFSLFKFSGIS